MKLYKSMLEQIYKTNLTKKELDTLLFLLQVQDDVGTIVNVHWNEIATKINMVAQSFYNCVSGLESKGFIKVSKTCPNGNKNGRGFHTIQMLVASAPVDPPVYGGVISQADLQKYIKESGSYLNLRNYSLINTAIFRSLKAEAKKVILNLLWRHQGTVALYGKPNVRSYDVNLTLEYGANMLGFNWREGIIGRPVRRKMQRYFEDVVNCGLLPVSQDNNGTLHWALDNMLDTLPECHLHADIPDADTDSIADTSNRRTINTILKQKKVKASVKDIQDALTVFDEQYRRVFGFKMLAAAVKDVVTDCVATFATLLPTFINKRCQELLSTITIDCAPVEPSPA